MKLALVIVAMLAACGGGDDAPSDRCSAVCPAGDGANCGFDGLACSCLSTGTACELDSCDDRNDAAPFCTTTLCTTSAPTCTYDGACSCLGNQPQPIECRTDACEA